MPFVPPQFSKFGKQVGDLFSKSYSFGSNVSITNKTDDGMKIEAGGKAKSNSTDFDGYAKINYADKSLGEFEGNLNTSGTLAGELTLNKLAKGVEVVIKANDSPKMSAKASYEQDFFAGCAEFGTDTKAHKLSVAGAIGHDGLSVGASVDLDLSGSVTDPLEYNLGTQYATKNYTACLLTSDKGETVAASFFQRVSESLSLGTKFTFKPEQNSRSMSFASEYALDPATCVKVKASTCSTVAMAVEHRLVDPRVKMTVAASFDSSKNFANKDFGVSLAFGDY